MTSYHSCGRICHCSETALVLSDGSSYNEQLKLHDWRSGNYVALNLNKFAGELGISDGGRSERLRHGEPAKNRRVS